MIFIPNKFVETHSRYCAITNVIKVTKHREGLGSSYKVVNKRFFSFSSMTELRFTLQLSLFSFFKMAKYRLRFIFCKFFSKKNFSIFLFSFKQYKKKQSLFGKFFPFLPNKT